MYFNQVYEKFDTKFPKVSALCKQAAIKLEKSEKGRD